MSYRLTHLALHTDGISTTEKMVLAALADYADDEKGICWPSQRTVAKLCGLSRKSVNASIAKLAKLGMVEIISHEGCSSTYRVNLASSDATHADKTMPKHVEHGQMRVSPSVTGGVTQGCRGVSPSVTQTEKRNKEEKRELKKEAVDSYIQTKVENPSVGVNHLSSGLVDPSSFDWDEISKSAVRQLVTEGFSAAEAEARVKAELEEAKWYVQQRSNDGWKNFNGERIQHPQKHTIGTLANLARKTKNLPPITRDELTEVVDSNPQVAEWLFCGEEEDDFWTFLVCRNFRNGQGETISRWNVQNTIRWFAEFRENLDRRRYGLMRLGA